MKSACSFRIRSNNVTIFKSRPSSSKSHTIEIPIAQFCYEKETGAARQYGCGGKALVSGQEPCAVARPRDGGMVYPGCADLFANGSGRRVGVVMPTIRGQAMEVMNGNSMR